VVFAVPGSPFDLRAEGPNDLIRQGATLLRDAHDVVEALQPQIGREFEPPIMSDSGGDRRDEPLWDEADWLGAGAYPAQGPSEPPFDGWAEPQPASARDLILGLLTAAPADPDDLARTAGLSIRELNLVLFDLESEERLERHKGGMVSARV
jgi:DNA processing protein